MPIKTEDTKSNKYIKGVSCPHCYDLRSKEQKKDLLQDKLKLIMLIKKKKIIRLKKLLFTNCFN